MGVILLLLYLLAFYEQVLSVSCLIIPRLSLGKRSYHTTRSISTSGNEDFQTYTYTQTLDHFNYRPESYSTFQQRYVMNSKYWGRAHNNSPIFLYTGDESNIWNDVDAAGIMTDNAEHFKALLVYIEHRYYGSSVPFGSETEAFRNSSTLGYFNSAQALADYAEIVVDLKKNLSAQNCPVIAMGGSYGGMLASWFRLKYPHITLGALASSAPILYFDDITPQSGYDSVVTKDFRDASESCYNFIKESWSEVDRIASLPDGLKILSLKFKSCRPLKNSKDLKDYFEYIFDVAAQYDHPPEYPVNKTCKVIDGLPQGTNVLSRIFAAAVYVDGEQDCYDIPRNNPYAWRWQQCSDIVMPFGRGSDDTMFQASPFDLKNYTRECEDLFGVTPRPHWITTEFGGHDIKMVLKKFGSNIIFSNGLRDPYSSGGVLQNISESIVALYTPQGSHCLDILPRSSDDPEWLVLQRDTEIKIIAEWIDQYNVELANETRHLDSHLNIKDFT